MTTVTLHEGDNRDSLRRLIDQGVRVHSVVCDPPYGLTSIQKRFGKDGAAPAKFGSDGAFARASAGFMGSKWDGTGIERDPEFWRLIYEILLPGGYVVAFSGSRTGHWQACAMEMAGFVMHPFLGWVYGQGFPKAHSAGQAVEKQLTIGKARRPDRDLGGLSRNRWSGSEEGTLFSDTGGRIDPTTPEAQQWDGWAYGGQALKPALEPIYVGQKPFSEKNGALNLLKHGVGAINVDGCRVHGEDAQGGSYTVKRLKPGAELNRTGGNWRPENDDAPTYTGEMKPGRHPANLLHDGSADVVALFPDSGGTGSAARFFNSFPLDADPIRYHGKATKADRAGSKHPTVKPIALMQWLCRLVTPPGGTVLDPFAGSGTTGAAARAEGFDCILMEAEAQFAADIRRRFGLATNDDFDTLAAVDDFEALC